MPSISSTEEWTDGEVPTSGFSQKTSSNSSSVLSVAEAEVEDEDGVGRRTLRNVVASS